MSNIELVIVTMVELAGILLLWASIEPRLMKNKLRLLTILLLITASTNIVSQFDLSYAAALRLMLSFIIVWTIIRLPFSELLVSYFTSILLIGVTQLVVITVMAMFGITYDGIEFSVTLATNILILSCVYVIHRFIPLQAVRILLKRNNKAIYYSLINLLFLLMFILVAWDTNKIFFVDSIYVIFVGFLLWVVINVIMVIQHLAYKDKERQLKVHEDYIPIINNLVDEVRAVQHDHHHHLHTLYGLCEISNEITLKEDIIKYLDHVIDLNKKSNHLVSLNNRFLSALFYSKIKMAEKESVNINIRIKHEPIFDVQQYDLVELVGNLIDNAIEATQKTMIDKRENVTVIVDEIDGIGLVTVSNLIPRGASINISRMFKPGYTTKDSPGHGYGLRKVSEIISSVNGKTLVEVEDRRISITCQLPIKRDYLFN